MLKRNKIKGFTLRVFNYYIEFVFINYIVKTIAINRRRLDSKTFYLLEV